MCAFSFFLSQHMKLKEIMDNKNYTEFFEDEKELLWKLRAEVRDYYPESLSKLLLITKWNKREDVLQVKIDTFNLNSNSSSSAKQNKIFSASLD